jgi:hypothetical protein
MLPKAQIEFFETRADSGGSEQRHTAEDSSCRGHPPVAPGQGRLLPYGGTASSFLPLTHEPLRRPTRPGLPGELA